ncbi:MAG: chorismate-binding protein [Candidatus Nanopelagicales bacterium]
MTRRAEPAAWFRGWLATGLCEVTDDPAVLDHGGRWAVSVTFEGALTAARFRRWGRQEQRGRAQLAGRWKGPEPEAWSTGLDQAGYQDAVTAIRGHIAAGEVYQANLCRVLRAVLPDERSTDVAALALILERGNPSPFGGMLRLPEHGIHIASASPELFLRRRAGRLTSMPIKGTARVVADLGEKDHAENIMIVDLVRNDLARVCRDGTVLVDRLCAVEAHPGLLHLVSQVSGELRPGTSWAQILAATFPPGSVSGAPKSSALRIIEQLEAGPRGPYCGAFGWIDADQNTAELAVAIRTFWLEGEGPSVAFGTGAGITWGSDPAREWQETELKAARLLTVARG